MSENKTELKSKWMRRAFADVTVERWRQDGKFGKDRNHNPFVWLSILGEEVGEANEAALIAHLVDGEGKKNPRGLMDFRDEMVQVAAVAVAVIEYVDRTWEAEYAALPSGTSGREQEI